MITFIELLPLELREITDYLEPNSATGTNDHEVGTMSKDLKKLYTLWNNAKKNAIIMRAEREFGRVDNETEYDAKIEEIAERAEVLRRIFWFCVRIEHSLWGKDSIGVRKGFTVVWSDQDLGESPLRRLFEGL